MRWTGNAHTVDDVKRVHDTWNIVQHNHAKDVIIQSIYNDRVHFNMVTYVEMGESISQH